MSTLKKFNQTVKQLEGAKRKERELTQLIRDRKNTLSTDFYLGFCQELIKKLESWIDQLNTVFVKASIGSRSYYREVIKIGKSYFTHNRKMTRSNGWHGVIEIEEITESMTEEMISDSHYY